MLLAQLDAGRVNLQLEKVDLSEMLLTAVDDLAAFTEDKNLTLEIDLPDEIPALADTGRTGVIIQNLTENAVKYTPRNGTIWIRAKVDVDYTSVTVANTCPPIPPEHHAKLFDRFYRANQGETIKGTGLGLNISRSLARAQQGELRLTKSDGQSTEFELLLRNVSINSDS